MKKLTMLFVVAAAAALGAWAEMETVGGYTWTYSISVAVKAKADNCS